MPKNLNFDPKWVGFGFTNGMTETFKDNPGDNNDITNIFFMKSTFPSQNFMKCYENFRIFSIKVWKFGLDEFFPLHNMSSQIMR